MFSHCKIIDDQDTALLTEPEKAFLEKRCEASFRKAEKALRADFGKAPVHIYVIEKDPAFFDIEHRYLKGEELTVSGVARYLDNSLTSGGNLATGEGLQPLLIYILVRRPFFLQNRGNLPTKHLRRHLRSFQRQMDGIMGHELHHVWRTVRCRRHYGETLGEAIISEGLALCFDDELTDRKSWISHYTIGKDFESYKSRVIPLLSKRERISRATQGQRTGCDVRLFGEEGNKNYPKFCGYALGYVIVSAWLKEHQTTAARHAKVSAKTILDWWMAKEKTPKPLPRTRPLLSLAQG